jgi:cob(I)alamin adenosyltransferase
MKRGYIQVYTGNGKGKTTAALGLTTRAVGADLRVLWIQFIKSGAYSELEGLRYFGDRVSLEQFGTGRFVMREPTPEDKALAERGLRRLRETFEAGDFDVVILDEFNVALSKGLLSLDSALQLLSEKPEHFEVVCTGRNAPSELCAMADLVTEMRELKHYYSDGVAARRGIEK